MRCLILGIGMILFAVALLCSLFLPIRAIVFAQCIIMIAGGFFLLKK